MSIYMGNQGFWALRRFREIACVSSSYVISPWIPKNLAIPKPTGPEKTSQWDLTSGLVSLSLSLSLSL